jgi:hypothetical protein
MQDIALAGFLMTQEEWNALDAASRALLLAIARSPEELAREEAPVEAPMLAAGSAPISPA